ncbi:E3 ubiquitin-protein ligase arih1 [Gossypium hirsutum]|uniref:E3 ubiquitin-protein ligase arih1 n=1 Tax=Gossypium hirsutum TaxID=3635 RepID=A0ABM2ZHI9_GOSHI|nr:E3 ubiquitin-protein ligase arih1 [Gossypium hirsutum]
MVVSQLMCVKSMLRQSHWGSLSTLGCSHFYCIECAVKYIQSKLDDNVSESNVQWGKALCESALLASEKFYKVLIKIARHCVDCNKFQKLKTLGSDNTFVDLATRKKWRQCPNCKMLVGKSFGCHHVKCRCGERFCYNYGGKLNNRPHPWCM